jgi:hypothetical protein
MLLGDMVVDLVNSSLVETPGIINMLHKEIDMQVFAYLKRVHHVTGCEVLVDEMLWPDSPSFGFLSIPNERPSKSWILINVENLNESPFIKATLHIVPCDLDIGQCSIQQKGLLSVQRKVYQLADENRDCALE